MHLFCLLDGELTKAELKEINELLPDLDSKVQCLCMAFCCGMHVYYEKFFYRAD